jgi:hypothetical protein
MNKLISGLTVLFLSMVVSYAGVPLSYTLSTNSVQILSERPLYTGIASWVASTAYAQGAIVQNLGSYYFAMNSGTSSNAGVGPSFRNTYGTDNNITWSPVSRNNRTEICVVNGSSDKVYISVGLPAMSGKGVLLYPSNFPFRITGYQGQVYAVSEATNSVITVQEW